MARASLPVVVDAPGVPPAAWGGCHAVRARGLTWIGAVCGRASDTAPYPREAVAELDQALAHLRAVLAATGHDASDLLRVNVYYSPSRVSRDELMACRAALAAAVEGAACAGVSAMLAPAAEGARIVLDAIAADRGSKEVLPAVPSAEASAWARATRSGGTILVSAVASADPLAPPASAAGGSPFFAHSYSAYRELARAIAAVQERWPDCTGAGDVVRLHQHVTHSDIDLAEFRRSREDLFRTGDFVSTTVLAGADDPDRPGRDPWIKIDAELAIGHRERVSVPGVWANPGGLHAVTVGGLAFLQAQMGRDSAGTSVHADDPERHAVQVYANIDRMLAGAGLEWRNVVHARLFCRDARQVPPAARLLEARVAGHPCASTFLIAGFFDRRALLEIEVTAAA